MLPQGEVSKAISWCGRPDSNRHSAFAPRDFKSLASTCSATPALGESSIGAACAGSAGHPCPSAIPLVGRRRQIGRRPSRAALRAAASG